MDISLGVLFGILAMSCWGTADFFVAKAVRKTSVFKTFVWSQTIGLLLMLIVFFLFFQLPVLSTATIAIILITGFLGMIAYLSFYKGLEVGKVSIISPIAACWAVVTVVLSLVFLGETLTYIQAAGVSLAILGAVFVSFRFKDLVRLRLKKTMTGVGYAVIGVFGWGVGFVLIAVLVRELSWFLPMFLIKVAMVFYLLSYGFAKKSLGFPRNVTLFILLIGILEVVAFLSYGVGITSEYTSIVAPIGAAFPMVTIILARIFLKEILETNQKIGVLFVLAGVVLLSVS